MKRILITGVSGYIGGKIAHTLAGHEKVERLVGIDIRAPQAPPTRLTFVQHDVRKPMADLFSRHTIDTVIHAAYVLPPIHNRALMEDINVSGTRNVMAACQQTGVEHLLYTSSATAYGFHPDNEIPLTEDSPLRGNDDFTYSKNKKEIEFIFQDLIRNQKKTAVTILRPCFVVGPGFNNPLATHLKKRFVLCPSPSAPMQFVHEDDLVRVIRLCLEKRLEGVYNVGGEGTLTLKEMVRLLGNVHCPLPAAVMKPINHLAWFLRMTWLTEFPSPALNIMRYPWVVSPDKFIRDTGFTYQHDTQTAFRDFAGAVKKERGSGGG
jgi:UDP-glucose 4-epimerase